MKKKKLLFSTLLVSGFLALSSCSLFNDDDLEVKNSFNPPVETSEAVDPQGVYAGGVKGKRIDEVNNAYCFKNICYATEGKIANTYKTGGANENEFNVNNGQDYDGDQTSNNYDLYVPDSANKNDKHIVMLFIHGGAWISGFKTDVNPYIYEFANRGYITATIKYSLLKKTMDDSTLSIFRDLDEIDACIKSIKASLTELGFDTTKTKLVIGGGSIGSHLAMLYSYSRGANAALPIQFIVDAVGPVDIKPESWKSFINDSDEVLTAGITYDAIATQQAASNIGELYIAGDSNAWNDFQTMRIANGMCGIPYSLSDIAASSSNGETITNPNEASTAMTKVGGGEDQLSVTSYINATNKIPMICAYGGKDSIVGINQYARLEKALLDNTIDHEFFYFKESDHTEITKKKDETTYLAFLNKINDWCQAL